MDRAFSACVGGDKSPGAAPQAKRDMAPSALKAVPDLSSRLNDSFVCFFDSRGLIWKIKNQHLVQSNPIVRVPRAGIGKDDLIPRL
jgi:hypothetical protein